MFYLFVIAIVNSLVSARGFQNIYRISLGGVEVGILETMLGLGLLFSLVLGGGIRAKQPTDRTHPAYVLCVGLLLVGFAFGVIGSVTHAAPSHYKMVFMREFFGMPAAVIIGYSLTGTMRSAQKFPYAMVIAGLCVSFMLMAAFGRGAERYELKGDWGALRSINFVTNYAGVACGLLIFSVLSGEKLFKAPIALGLAGFCFLGQLTPLHRSDWLAQAVAIAAIPFCLPAGSRLKHFLGLIGACFALTVSLWIGLHVASAATGRNFHKTFEDRLVSMLPGAETKKGSQSKAWETRLPAIYSELNYWMTNPLMGRGFAIEESTGLGGAAAVGFGYHHNAYTSTLAQTGIVGFGGAVMAIFCPIIIGYRLVRDRWSRATILIGALGIIAGVQQAVLGMATASWNGYRIAMMIGLICGMVFRVRDLELTERRQLAELGYIPNAEGPRGGQPVMNDMLPIPDFDDHGRPLGAYTPGYN